MAFQPEKKLADAFHAVRPSEELVRETEHAMHAALLGQQTKQKPKILRYAASAACAAVICLSVFLGVWQWLVPADRTGQPSTQLLSSDPELYRKAAARTAVEQYGCASPSMQEMIDELHQSLNDSDAGELIADGVCRRVEYYQIPASDQPAALLTVRLTAIQHCENAPRRLKNGDQITVVCFPSELSNPAEDTPYRFSLSTAQDGNVYSDDGILLAESAWLLYGAWQQTAEAQQVHP